MEILTVTDRGLGQASHVSCGHGERATNAASILSSRGREHLTALAGGPDDGHRTTGQPLETGG